MEVISKDSIKEWIVPFLSTGKRGRKPQVELSEIVGAILYKLKSGCQWRQLPVKQFFGEKSLSWQGVYHHFRKWVSAGSIRKVWVELLKQQRGLLDLSCVQLDGSQTICKNGGDCIGYQNRKAAKSCNSLFLADNQGLMLAGSYPVAGQHHDLYQIRQVFEELGALLKEADIDIAGLFLNADAGFDSQVFRQQCSEMKIEANIAFNPRKGEPSEEYVYFDAELFKRRNVIERANAWLESFKTLLIRFETKAQHWRAFHFLAFTVQLIRKINKSPKL
ncbi:IS5 family transposase [Adhaeribacter radiodurans]|uniref:IS5 family transposase n=1 Tax=Adhaeribacter radiodurans TaxID=2745197 RepID=A0A7L7LE04_9BACT|nr:IS5 family transposase [Adhaeribacter radiodurans]QMU30987.1 IS5 family transposase [Adhaeribacter radiodurans]